MKNKWVKCLVNKKSKWTSSKYSSPIIIARGSSVNPMAMILQEKYTGNVFFFVFFYRNALKMRKKMVRG